jgi:CubicO group peptidase (beta-lactamase class C family)
MRKILVVIIACSAYVNCFSQTVAEKLDQYFAAAQKAGSFNGSVLIVEKGKVLLNKGYGYNDAEAKTMADANTIYQIGSVTKQFTSTIILKLAEQGKLKLDDKVSKYFPTLPNAERVAIENLLTHTSGYYNYTNNESFMENEVEKHADQKKIFSLFADSALAFEPGTKFSYSNSGYMLLGYIIEKVTGKKYEQVVRTEIFTPLKMTSSGFDFTHLKSVDRATGYDFLAGDKNKKSSIVDSSVSFSAGAIYSTIGDMYKWNQALSTEKILKRQSLQNAFTPRLEHYGLGWGIDTMKGHKVIAHNGGINGFLSHNSFLPNDSIYITILSNFGSSKIGLESKDALAIVLKENYTLPKAHEEITLDSTVLKKYVGEYELAPTFKIVVRLVNGALQAQATGQPSFDLYAKSENIFFLKVVDAQVEFVKNEKGEVEKMILHQNGQHIPGKKIN